MLSLLDHRFAYTEFPDIKARSKEERQITLRQLARRIERATGETKEQLRWLKLATFGDRRSAGGSLRNNANMLAITGIELDYDAGDLLWDQAWARLYEAGLSALLYTSPRYAPERPRVRVLLPTSAALPVAERTALVARACSVLRGTVDQASYTASQAYYFGTARRVRDGDEGDWRDGFPVRVQAIDPPNGRFIDEASDAPTCEADSYEDAAQPSDGESTQAPDFERLKSILSYVPSGHYHDWLRVGMAVHDVFDGGEDGFDLWDEWSQSTEAGNYNSAGQQRTWNSFSADRTEAHVGYGTLVYMAKEHGYTPTSSDDVEASLRLWSTRDCEAAKPPPYVWKSALAEGQIACIFGAPGAGKSLIGPYIAYRIALGEPAFGLRAKPGNVLYVAAEDATGMRKRVAALARRLGHTNRFCLVDAVSDLFAEDGDDLSRLKAAMRTHEPSVIVIDTLAAAFPGLEENDAKSMGRVVTVARELASLGAAVVLIHHDTKAETGTPRGHSVLNGAFDMTMHVKRGDGGVVRGTFRKNRNGTTDRDIAFHIDVEEFGEDEDGDAITAPIVVELEGAGTPRQPALSKAQRAALAKLDSRLKEGIATHDQWQADCVDGFDISPAPERRSRQAAFRRAREALIRANVVQISPLGKVTRVETISGDAWL